MERHRSKPLLRRPRRGNYRRDVTRAAVVDVDTTVLTSLTSAGLFRFNPYTEEPVAGLHYVTGESFGEPVRSGDYQAPRTFQVSLGVRF
jgi:hypothetical protein